MTPPTGRTFVFYAGLSTLIISAGAVSPSSRLLAQTGRMSALVCRKGFVSVGHRFHHIAIAAPLSRGRSPPVSSGCRLPSNSEAA